jgi:glucose/arabinose dehydrogenase
METKPHYTIHLSFAKLIMLPIISVLLHALVYAQTLPQGFVKVQVANNIINPTAMAFSPDGRIFVTQQNGIVKIIKNGSLLTTPFLQLQVQSASERGLIGITLDPNFSQNQYVYLYYTLPDGSRNRISRFTGNGDVVVAGSEVVILNLDPLSSATNHNGGMMHFGKDGKLYVAVGDNANPNNAQNLDTYHGKLLRINKDGTIPAGRKRKALRSKGCVR